MKKFNQFLLVLNLFLLQSYLLRFSIGFYSTNLQEILLLLQVVVFGASVFQTRKFSEVWRRLSRHWVLWIFLILTGFSVLANHIFSQLDFFRYVKFLFFAVVLVFIFLETYRSELERRQGLRWVALGALVFGIFSVTLNLLGYNVAYDYRLQGPLDAAVYLGYYLSPAFLYFLIEYFEEPAHKLHLVYAILLGIFLLATRSMGSIAAVFLVMLIYFLKHHNTKILRSRTAKLSLAVFFVVIFSGVFFTKILPSFSTSNTSLGERDEIWATAFYLLKSPQNLFLGLGPAQFEYHYIQTVDHVIGHKPLDYHIIQPHNLFLLFLFNYGIWGVIFLVFCMVRAVQIFMKNEGKVTVKSLACLMLFYFFLHGMIDTPIFKNDLLILFMLFLELALADTHEA